jgi:gamma-butyrobetaine dioxygenase
VTTASADYERGDADQVRAVRGLGFARLTGTRSPGTEVEVEFAARFRFVQTTNYGRWFDVRSERDATNLALTDRAITPHTDNPHRDPLRRSNCCIAPCTQSPTVQASSSTVSRWRPGCAPRRR